MSPRLKRILSWVGYLAFYLFCLVLFAYLTFPYDRLRARVESEFNARQTGPSPLHLRVGELGSYWLSGLEARDIRLTSPPAPQALDSDKPPKPRVLRVDSAHARVSLLHLLFGTTQVDFGADAFGGQLSGVTSDADNARRLELELGELSLSDVPLLPELIGLPVQGRLSGHVELLLPESKLSKAEGKLELHFENLAVGDGKAKIRGAIALPKLDVGSFQLAAEARAGTVKIGNFSAGGKDLELAADGSLRLRDNLDSSTLSVNMRFKFNDRFVNKDDVTRGLFGTSSMPGLFDLDPTIKHAKRPDGFYGWRIGGSVSHPVFAPAPAALGDVGHTLLP